MRFIDSEIATEPLCINLENRQVRDSDDETAEVGSLFLVQDAGRTIRRARPAVLRSVDRQGRLGADVDAFRERENAEGVPKGLGVGTGC